MRNILFRARGGVSTTPLTNQRLSRGQYRLRAFTLIELAIVLVVISLIAGAVIGGRALVAQAQLRAFLNELEKYNTLSHLFYAQYETIPGDLDTATLYWSTAHNGNGNKQIDSTYTEAMYAWEHLYRANLISSVFTGSYPGGQFHVGIDIPASTWRDSGLTYAGNTRTLYLETGAETSGDRSVTNVFSGPEAYAIDIKIDDGIPASIATAAGETKVRGDISGYQSYYMGGGWGNSSCMSGSGASSTYNISNLSIRSCRLGFTMK